MKTLLLAAGLLAFSLSAQATTKTVPKNAHVFFVSPKDGAKVKSPFKVVFGLKGMKIKPAGIDPDDKSSGHHHLLIDTTFVKEGEVVPTDENHKHFGKGQTETELTLHAGKHTLTLQFADGAHRSYGKKLSSTITVDVE